MYIRNEKDLIEPAYLPILFIAAFLILVYRNKTRGKKIVYVYLNVTCVEENTNFCITKIELLFSYSLTLKYTFLNMFAISIIRTMKKKMQMI